MEPTTVEDIPVLSRWIQADPYHRDHLDPLWWLTGTDCRLAYKVVDDEGTTLYMRTDIDGDRLRLHTQFGTEEVSKKRTATSLLWGWPAMIQLAKKDGLRGCVFESTSPTLIAFMAKQRFKPAGNNDYEFLFEG
jgi:hypothetical protein